MGVTKDLMFSNYSSSLCKGDNRTIFTPSSLQVVDNKCVQCNMQITKEVNINRELTYECKYCRSSWSGGCSCSYEEYECTYVKCNNCISNFRCVECDAYDENICIGCKICNRCMIKKIDDNRYVLNVHYSEKDQVKALGAKWDTINKKWYVPLHIDYTKFNKWNPKKSDMILCNECSIICHKCQNRVHKHFIRIHPSGNNICSDCAKRCDKCKMICNKLILHGLTDYCEKCFDINYNPSTSSNVYGMKINRMNMAEINIYFLEEWELIKEKLCCKICSNEYWYVISDKSKPKWFKHPSNSYPYKSWQRDDIEYLKNCCEKCYNERHSQMLEKYVLENIDPSDESNCYELDEYYFKWNKKFVMNNCHKCNEKILICLFDESKRNQFKFCKKCNPSNDHQKYIFSEDKNNWVLDKVKIYDKRHKWINPTLTFNEYYKCVCK